MTILDDYKQLRRQHEEALRFLAILVERAGGDILLLPGELAVDRQLTKNDDVVGSVRLTVKRL